MASANAQDVPAEPPRKRQKLSPPPSTSRTPATKTQQSGKQVATIETQMTQTRVVVSDNGFQPEREAQVGILHFVNGTNPGFSGTLKQRYVLGHLLSFNVFPWGFR